MTNTRCNGCMLGCWVTLVCLLSLTHALQEYSTTYSEKYPQNQIEDSGQLSKLLTMASKGSNVQRFYPPSRLAEVNEDKRAITNLHRAMYLEKNYPILQKLYPELLRGESGSTGGNKRLDAASFFGVRGKRPRRRYSGESELSSDEMDSFYSDKIKRSEGPISMKRQPPPGFHALRG